MAVLWLAALALAAPGSAHSQAGRLTAGGSTPKAPPPAPPVQVAPSQTLQELQEAEPAGGTLYSIGDPTDEEQLYLEYINRARANPSAEGALLAGTTDPAVLFSYSYFSVNLSLMQSQFNVLTPVPPLAMNAKLTAAARLHSQDMFINQYQDHVGSDGTNYDGRITAQGYSWSLCAENVYASSESVFYGHAGFEVDWGDIGATGGMQDPPGHRQNIHSSAVREVGVGVVDGVNGDVGPQLVTQDFGTQLSAKPLILGVVYYDINSNTVYDVGEGLGAATVQVPGSAYYAVTANSGGYAVPVTTNGVYAMTFAVPGLPTNAAVATVTNLSNVKVDYRLAYSPPAIAGPNPAALNENNHYSFTGVGGATNYQWEYSRLVPYAAVEGAENGSNYVTISSTPGYSVFSSTVRASGSFSFHLCHPSGTVQRVTFNATLRPRINSQLTFAKRLGYATTTEVARAQVSVDSGASWQDVWTQTGSGGSGEPGFSRITNSLSAFANTTLRLRFIYDFIGGSYYLPSDGSGLYLDDIAVSNADEAQSPLTNGVAAGTSFVFSPTNTFDYSLRVRAFLPGRILNWGPSSRVAVSNLPPMAIRFTGQPASTGSLFRADFSVANYRSAAPLLLLKTADLGGNWSTDTTASVQTLISNTSFRVTTTNTATRAFFRIGGSY